MTVQTHAAEPRPSIFALYPNESLWLAFCIALGLAIAVILSPKDQFFLGSFLLFWAPLAVIIGIALPLSERPATVAGVAFSVALYLAAYALWLSVRTGIHSNGFEWVIYLFTFPGAVLGAIVGAYLAKSHDTKSALALGAIAGTCTFVGLSLNLVTMCSTIAYCGF